PLRRAHRPPPHALQPHHRDARRHRRHAPLARLLLPRALQPPHAPRLPQRKERTHSPPSRVPLLALLRCAHVLAPLWALWDVAVGEERVACSVQGSGGETHCEFPGAGEYGVLGAGERGVLELEGGHGVDAGVPE
ncbi:hypothetical protein V492_05574, partial [Pseudogymnoascus sp. VKM F-4246]